MRIRAGPTIGRSGFILDNLIAEGKAKPMIVVMPNGSMPLPAQTGMPGTQTMNRMGELFASELLKDVMPTVEKTYRTLATADNRAIAGLSMGGFQTLDVTLTHPELFQYVGVFSSGFFGATADEAGTKYAKVLTDPSFNKGQKALLDRDRERRFCDGRQQKNAGPAGSNTRSTTSTKKPPEATPGSTGGSTSMNTYPCCSGSFA